MITRCLNLTEAQYHAMFFSMVGLFSLSVVLSCVAVFMLVTISGLKVFLPYRTAVSPILQLTLYILISVFFYNGTELLKAIPSFLEISERETAVGTKLCQASGFLVEYFALVTYLLAFLTTLYIMGKYIFGCKCTCKCITVPVMILIFGVSAPLTIAWIPFLTRNYRLAGAWCWIAVNDENCKLDKVGLSEEIVLYYLLVFTFSFIMFITAVVVLCSLCGCCLKRPKSVSRQQKAELRKGQLEFIPLLIYPIVFTAFFCIDVTQRILFAVSTKQMFGLWLVHAIGGNTACLLVPIAFIIHPLNLSRFYQKLKRNMTVKPTTASEADPLIQSSRDHKTIHIVPPSTSGDDPLIIQEE